MNRRHNYRVLALLAPVCLAATQAQAQYTETKMISNEPGVAPITDPNLIDPWGVAFSATSPLWVSNQGSGTATVYKITGTSSSATSLTEGVANIGGAAAEPRERPHGPSKHSRTGNHNRCDRLSGQRRQGIIYFRQPGRLDLSLARRAIQFGHHGDGHRRIVHRPGDRRYHRRRSSDLCRRSEQRQRRYI